VHAGFQIWSELNEEGVSLLKQALKKSGWHNPKETEAQCLQRVLDRGCAARKENMDTARQKGYDAGKKIPEIKRHIAVDTQGLPHAVAITMAKVTDRKEALWALNRCKATLVKVQSLLCDSGYVGQPFKQRV